MFEWNNKRSLPSISAYSFLILHFHIVCLIFAGRFCRFLLRLILYIVYVKHGIYDVVLHTDKQTKCSATLCKQYCLFQNIIISEKYKEKIEQISVFEEVRDILQFLYALCVCVYLNIHLWHGI